MSSPADLDPQILLAQMGWMRALARKLVTDQHLAEDLAQDAYVIALERSPSDPERLRGWLAGVLYNLSRRIGSGPRPQPVGDREFETQASEESESTASLTERVEAQGALVQIVLDLDERKRRVVLEHYFENKSVRLISRELGQPESNVRRQLRDAHELLRRKLERKLGRDAGVWSVALLGLPLDKVVPASAPAGGGLLTGKLMVGGLFATAGLAVTLLVVRIAGSGAALWDPVAVEAAEPVKTQAPPTLAEASSDLRSVTSIPARADAETTPAERAAADSSVDPEPPARALSPTLGDASYDRLLAAIEATLDGQIDLGVLVGLSQEFLDSVDLEPGTEPGPGTPGRLAYTLPTSFDSLTATLQFDARTDPLEPGANIYLRLDLRPRDGVLHTISGIVRTSGILEVQVVRAQEGQPDQFLVFTDLEPAGNGLNAADTFSPKEFQSRGVTLTIDPRSPGDVSGSANGRKGNRTASRPIPLTLVGSTPTSADLERFAARLNDLLAKAKG